jgi:hypothetical protein
VDNESGGAAALRPEKGDSIAVEGGVADRVNQGKERVMAAFNFHRRKTRRWWYAGATLVAAAVFSVVFVGGASANLTGSSFEGNDANLVVDTSGNTDWCTNFPAPTSPDLCTTPFPGLHKGVDLASGSGDNSFGQGTKEDNSIVTVVSGSIPPQKSDLTRFYEASEVTGSSVFLYLAWERTNNLGNANMDFEINQKNPATATGTVCPDGAGTCTIPRLNGDMLITYDFGGSGAPALGLNRWLTVNGTNPYAGKTGGPPAGTLNTNADCYNANKLPCWGDHKDLGSTISEGAVNTTGSVYDPIGVTGQTAGRTIVQDGFGEAAINLTDAGVVSPGTCDFGSATTFLKSRSSSSFTSEIKDFIAPVPTPVVPCQGAITVTKQAKNHNCTAAGLAGSTADATCIGPATQAQAGAGFTFYKESNGCLGLQTATVTCHDGGLNDGLSVDADTTAGTGTTALATGGVPPATTCLPNLDLGTYYVRETTTPTGFATQADKTVSVSTQGDCTSGSAAVNFTGTSADQPLTKLTVNVDSVVAGASNSSVSCVVGTAGAAIGNSPQPATGKADPVRFKADGTAGAPALTPGTYTCTVVVDP